MSNQIANVQTGSMVLNVESMNAAVQFAQMMCSGVTTVPKHLQKNSADCLAVTMQAMQWGMNPYAVAQKTHLVSGTLGYEAQLVNAVITTSTAIVGRFHYEYGGNWTVTGGAEKQEKGVNVNTGSKIDPTCWVRVGAVLKGEDEIQWGEKLFPSNVTVKNSPLWTTNPKQQASYLALKYWARLYAPAVIMGVYTPDELQEFEPSEPRDITPKKQSAMKIPEIEENKTASEAEPEQSKIEYITAMQSSEIEKACDFSGIDIMEFCSIAKIANIDLLPADKYDGAINWIKSQAIE